MISGSFPACLLEAEGQRTLFADRLRRDDLLRLPRHLGGSALRINIHRNHAFEPVAAHLRTFLEYAGWSPEFTFSSYDDSFLFHAYSPADLEIVWIDYDRYSVSSEALLQWLAERLAALRGLSDRMMLLPDRVGDPDSAFNAALRAVASRVTGVRVWPQSEVAASLDGEYFDDRLAALTGTRLSGAACLHVARFLGCVSIPPCLAPRIKAIVTDLDNTLYEGILGEDGAAGLVLKPEHRQVQDTLVKMRQEGIFLGIVSRNDPSDVERMFRERPDFPLRLADFSARSIGWHAKSEGIRAVVAQLRIGIDSVLFIDDNPGELLEVAVQLPGIRTIHAAAPGLTAQALHWYPGLNGYERTVEGTLRIDDLAAAEIRAREMAQHHDPSEYFRALNIELEFALNLSEHTQRLHELSIKTNQFNTALLRLSAVEVERRLTTAGNAVVSIRMQDRLSDSGIVGALFARREERAIIVDEIAISCRALGRQMEDIMITEAIGGVARAFHAAAGDVSSVEFFYQEGPRNQPGRTWLARYTGQEPHSTGRLSIPLAALSCREDASELVSIRWRDHGPVNV
jgi:FkbH-like protein